MSFLRDKTVFLFFRLGKFDLLSIEWAGILDRMSLMFLITVSLIRYSVFNFSFGYIARDASNRRFHILLLTFVISILVLILSNNYIRLIIGWDGLGIRSYLLVIYYGRVKSYSAGIVTFLTNRVGDFFIMLRLLLLGPIMSFNIVFYSTRMLNDPFFIALLLRGAFTKRAQIPFRAWLPAAIAAPTPVSSLVHSSTLVTAGVYLLIRHCYFGNNYLGIEVVFMVGTATIIIARLAALNEKDIKKIIALSTLRQLGVMVIRIGLCLRRLSFLHLVIHAFFKAIMFIRTGNLIHLRRGYQAVQHTGALFYNSPINSRIRHVAVLRLMGTPFSAAYFSKEPIIEITLNLSINLGLCYAAIVGVILTVLYSARFSLLTVLNNSSISREVWRSDKRFSLNKGIYCLLLPSFLRGSWVSSLIIKQPNIVVYSNQLKLVITIILLLSLVLILFREVRQFKRGEYRFFPMWNLRGFRRSIFNKLTLWQSRNSHSLRGRLFNVTLIQRLRGQLVQFTYLESNFIFRLVRVIPVSLVTLWLFI